MRRQPPARSYHRHLSCGHYCVGYGCDEARDCRKCRNNAFNEQAVAQAGPTERHPEGQP